MSTQILELSTIIIIFQLLLFIPFLFIKRKKLSNTILAAFFLNEIITFSSVLIKSNSDFVSEHVPFLNNICGAFTLLWCPLYYFYIKSLLAQNFKFTSKNSFHLFPFLIAFCFWVTDIILLRFYQSSFYYYLRINTYSLLIPSAVLVQIVVYNLLSIRLLKKTRTQLVQYNLNEKTYTWAQFFVFGYFVGCILNTVIWLIVITFHLSNWFYMFSYLYMFMFFNVIFFKALLNPEVFHFEEPDPSKYYYTGLTSNNENEIHSKLGEIMLNQKPYLQSSLSLAELSDLLDIPPRHLSQVINNIEKCTVPEYINRYRIEYIKEKLFDPKEKNKTFLELLYESGFNSKTAFNISFKKYTGYTPTQFRNINKLG